MKPEEINKAIAEAMGYTNIRYDWINGSDSIKDWMHDKGRGIPNYYNDLNACHEMEKTLTPDFWYDFTKALRAIIQRDCNKVECYIPGCERSQHIADFWFYHATAPQRCEAFLRTKGLLKE